MNTSKNEQPQEHSRSTLRVNLGENIQSLHPLQIQNRSERIVANLIYSGLYETNEFGQVVPSLINSHKLDSSTNTHIFTLLPNVAFHNGENLTTKEIYHCFKKLIDSENSCSQALVSDIYDYARYKLRKTSKIGTDSIPLGFKIVDQLTFSIRFIKPQRDLVYTLTKPCFLIYHDSGESYIGSGKYSLNYANGDISYLLKKRESHFSRTTGGLDMINIRFIKNKEAEINEFLNGSLDLIVSQTSSKSLKFFKNIENANYAKFLKYESSRTLLSHLTIHNFNSTVNQKLLLNLLADEAGLDAATLDRSNGSLVNEKIVYSQDSVDFYAQQFIEKNIKLNIPIVLQCKTECDTEFLKLKKRLSKHFDIYSISEERLNPNLPYLVLEESELAIYKATLGDDEYKYALERSKNHASSILTNIVISYKREYVVSNIMLEGLVSYANWEESLQSLYFKKPKEY